MAEKRVQRDMSSRSAVEGLARWIAKGSGALVVMVLRPEDEVFVIAPHISPSSAAAAVEVALPKMVALVNGARVAARKAAAEKAKGEALTVADVGDAVFRRGE